MTASRPGAERSRSLGVLAVLLTVVVAFLASQIVTGIALALALAAVALVGGLPAREMLTAGSVQELVRHPLMLSLATIATGSTIVLTGAIALRIVRAPFWSATAMRSARPLHLALGVLLVLSFGPFADLAATAFHKAFPRLTFGVLEGLHHAARSEGLTLLIFSLTVSIAPGVAEELFFRGVVQRSLVARIGAPAGILLASLIFGAFHLEPPQAVGAAILGVPLGFLVWRTGSLLPAMLAHAANNALAVVAIRAGVVETDAAPADAPLLGVAAVVMVGTGYALLRTTAPGSELSAPGRQLWP